LFDVYHAVGRSQRFARPSVWRPTFLGSSSLILSRRPHVGKNQPFRRGVHDFSSGELGQRVAERPLVDIPSTAMSTCCPNGVGRARELMLLDSNYECSARKASICLVSLLLRRNSEAIIISSIWAGLRDPMIAPVTAGFLNVQAMATTPAGTL
jgi:hypothetical protein